ncbi:MAG: winged helix-turn-helix transcriptional regulator [Candidatus Bathyarchaeia archaeon]
MVEEKTARSIGILGKSFVIEILEALNEGPKRFTDLKEHCPNDKTRANRIRCLKKEHLIEAVLADIGGQNVIHYVITERGREALTLLQRLEMLILFQNNKKVSSKPK